MSKVRYYNPSQKTWELTPYMVKEYSVLSPCKRFLATVVVIAKDETVEVKKGPQKGQTVEKTAFIPMGVRVEEVTSRKSREGFVLPGYCWFIKNAGKRSPVEMVSSSNPHTFETDRCDNLIMEGWRPVVNAPSQKWKGEPFTESKVYAKLKQVVELAREAYLAHMLEKRAAA